VRGWVDLAINGCWWFGTAAGAALSLALLNPAWFAVDLGWRLAFGWERRSDWGSCSPAGPSLRALAG
jgi:hypothetical protein